MDKNWHKKSLAEMGYADQSQHKGPVVGANTASKTLKLVPHPSNVKFNGGMGKWPSYSHYVDMDFSLDYNELAITFSMYRVRIKGYHLKGWAEAVSDFRQTVLEQKAADDAVAQDFKDRGEPVIYFMALEALEE